MSYENRIKKLNSLSEFINGEYQDDLILVLEKNFKEDKWNILCATMHWFNVVEMYLDSTHLLDEQMKDHNWGKIYLFLSAVDIVIEGINGINKIAKRNEKARLFCGENEIFKDEDKDDWEYFKNIRSIFGAHPTKLKDNKEYIVSTFPTPYYKENDFFSVKKEEWNYYTLLWSKEKGEGQNQKRFGFCFKDIENYLDKCINYLDTIYSEIMNMITDYKAEIAKMPIEKTENPIEQLNILVKEDNERLNKKYEFYLRKMSILIDTIITDRNNEKKYEKYKKLIENSITTIYNVIQYPNRSYSLKSIVDLISPPKELFDNYSNYCYEKLAEWYNNSDLGDLLINYFGNKIEPFNNNINNIRELYCLVNAYNYYRNNQ